MARPTLLFLTKSGNAASTRYRALAYFERLREAGWQPLHREAPTGVVGWRRLLPEVRDAEVVVLLRRLLQPLPRRWLRRHARRLVFDFDDAVFHGNAPQPSRSRARRFAALLPQCDQVWAGNQHLAAEASRHASDVRLLPTSVELAAYPEVEKFESEKPAGNDLDLVWIGSRSTRPYLEALLPSLEALSRRRPECRLKIVADFDLAAGPLRTLALPWSAETEAQALGTAQIGLAPMPDTPWSRGKCGCKVLQYMAARLPVVASRVPVHQSLVADGETGLLASSPSEWEQALERLADEPSLREQMGQAGRLRAEQAFSTEATFRSMRDALEQLLSGAASERS